jgi:hypothetical protein
LGFRLRKGQSEVGGAGSKGGDRVLALAHQKCDHHHHHHHNHHLGLKILNFEPLGAYSAVFPKKPKPFYVLITLFNNRNIAFVSTLQQN